MKNLQNDAAKAGEQTTLFSQGDSRANHTRPLESEKERRTSAIYGRRCLEQFERLPLVGSWAKTFSGLLIGTEVWSSKRCKLTWKLKGTKYNRTYFQLQVSTLPTKDIGSGLLLTPTSVMTVEDPKDMRARAEKNGYKNGTQYGSLASQVVYGFLPTPSSRDWKGRTNPGVKKEGSGNIYGETLPDTVHRMQGLLPTPATRDFKGERSKEALQKAGRDETNSLPDAFATTGETSQLNPRFVLEMMGFEPKHCDSAFEKIAWDYYLKKKSTQSFQKRLADGSRKPSKPEETQ